MSDVGYGHGLFGGFGVLCGRLSFRGLFGVARVAKPHCTLEDERAV